MEHEENLKIKAINNGLGEASSYFQINTQNIVKIERESKIIGKGYYNDLTMICYVGYDKNNNKLFTINEGVNLEIYYLNET